MTDEQPTVQPTAFGMNIVRLPSMPPDRALVVPYGWPGPFPHAVTTGEVSVHAWLREIADQARVITLDSEGLDEPRAVATITHVNGVHVDPGTVDPDQPPGLAGE